MYKYKITRILLILYLIENISEEISQKIAATLRILLTASVNFYLHENNRIIFIKFICHKFIFVLK